MNEIILAIGTIILFCMAGFFQAYLVYFSTILIKTLDHMSMIGGLCIIVFLISPALYLVVAIELPIISLVASIMSFLYGIFKLFNNDF